MINNKIKFAIVIVLYNEKPPTYVGEYSDVPIIIVDNTPNRTLSVNYPNVFYIPLRDNMGVAYALNVGFEKAISLGADWILSMDQDSLLPSNMLSEYENFILEGHDNIGVLAPLINMYQGEYKVSNCHFEKTKEALTSGSVVSSDAYMKSGGFKNELFIDDVDFEFCYNLASLGYTHYQLNSVIMQHQLGNTKQYKFFGKHLFYITHHNYIRHYYMQRNRMYLRHLYKEQFTGDSEIWANVKTMIKILVFEDDKLRKFKARKLAVRDFKNNKLGKFSHNL